MSLLIMIIINMIVVIPLCAALTYMYSFRISDILTKVLLFVSVFLIGYLLTVSLAILLYTQGSHIGTMNIVISLLNGFWIPCVGYLLGIFLYRRKVNFT